MSQNSYVYEVLVIFWVQTIDLLCNITTGTTFWGQVSYTSNKDETGLSRTYSWQMRGGGHALMIKEMFFVIKISFRKNNLELDKSNIIIRHA